MKTVDQDHVARPHDDYHLSGCPRDKAILWIYGDHSESRETVCMDCGSREYPPPSDQPEYQAYFVDSDHCCPCCWHPTEDLQERFGTLAERYGSDDPVYVLARLKNHRDNAVEEFRGDIRTLEELIQREKEGKSWKSTSSLS